MAFKPEQSRGGAVIPAHVPTMRSAPMFNDELAVYGLFFGVVLAVYRPGENDALYGATQRVTSRFYYADVLVWRDRAPAGPRFVPRALVLMDNGLHEGSTCELRPSSVYLSNGGTPNFNQIADLADLDGDQVAVGFFDNERARPVILGRASCMLPDAGNIRTIDEDVAAGLTASVDTHLLSQPGYRLRLGEDDPRTALRKFNGVVQGVDELGNVVVDSTWGHDGELLYDKDAEGRGVAREKRPEFFGISGNQLHRIPEGSTLRVEVIPEEDIAKKPTETPSQPRIMVFQLGDGGLSLTMYGDTPGHAALAEPLQALYNDLSAQIAAIRNALATHTHLLTPAATPTATLLPVEAPAINAITLPPWDEAIKTDQVTLPYSLITP